MSRSVSDQDFYESVVHTMRVRAHQHEGFAQQWRPRWYHCFLPWDKNIYDFHRAAVTANRALIRELIVCPDSACIFAFQQEGEKLERCVARHMMLADYTVPCTLEGAKAEFRFQ
jgi:hypothetical protein